MLVDIGIAVDGASGSVDQVVGPIVNDLLIECRVEYLDELFSRKSLGALWLVRLLRCRGG